MEAAARERDQRDQLFRLAQFAQEVRERFAPAAEKRSIVLRSKIAANLPAAYKGDLLGIEEMLNSFLDTSLYSSPDGSEITVRVKKDSRHADEQIKLRFSVTGSAAPLREEEREEYKQPFRTLGLLEHREESSLLRFQELATRLGGEVWVETKTGLESTLAFSAVLTPVEL